MMNTQASTFLGTLGPEALRELPSGHVIALGSRGGEVSILSGQVWLTRAGDPSDHVLGAGESFVIRDSGDTLVETWSPGMPAVIAWQPRSFAARIRDGFADAIARCRDLVIPIRRIGLGSVAAVAAVMVAGALFGPVSESRARTLAASIGSAGVLHNAGRGAAGATSGTVADDSDAGDRTTGAAQEAGRRAPGAA